MTGAGVGVGCGFRVLADVVGDGLAVGVLVDELAVAVLVTVAVDVTVAGTVVVAVGAGVTVVVAVGIALVVAIGGAVVIGVEPARPLTTLVVVCVMACLKVAQAGFCERSSRSKPKFCSRS